MLLLFASDLHGKPDRYDKLSREILHRKPDAVLLGGDLLPHGMAHGPVFDDFFQDFLLPSFLRLQVEMQADYPSVLLILGNDDARVHEEAFILAEDTGAWTYLHEKSVLLGEHEVFGYAYVPPTPFRLKDWERYDISRYADPGCIHPLEGFFTMEPLEDIEYQTIQQDLEKLASGKDLSKAIMLFHSPPYKTVLDRAALDGKFIDHVPLDVHVGSIAIKRFIDEKQPLLTLHGHIHESSSITGQWHEYIGSTLAVNGAWNGPELSLITFDTEDPGNITRELL